MATITNVEIKKASNGNTYKQVSFDKKFFGDKDRTNVFSDHAMYNDLNTGAMVNDSDLFVNPKGYLELTNPDKGVKKGYSRGVDPVQVAQAQERTKENVKIAQDNTSYNVKVSSTFRDATLLTLELMKHDPLAEYHVIHREVRAKLWEMWDIEKTDKIF